MEGKKTKKNSPPFNPRKASDLARPKHHISTRRKKKYGRQRGPCCRQVAESMGGEGEGAAWGQREVNLPFLGTPEYSEGPNWECLSLQPGPSPSTVVVTC